MPERAADRRSLECQELEAQLDRWDKDLRDHDWIQRVKESKDWKRLCELFREEFKPTKDSLEQIKKALMTEPMTPEQTCKVREGAMLMQRDLDVMENLLTFPDRETVRLEEIEKKFPEQKAKLQQLKKALDR